MPEDNFVIFEPNKATLSIPLMLQVSGVPVVKSNTDYTLVGVLSKKDLSKGGNTVKELMTSPPIAARPDNKVADAACLMLKHKVGLPSTLIYQISKFGYTI